MHTFAQKPEAARQTTPARSTIPGWGHADEERRRLHLHRIIENQGMRRTREADAEDGGGDSTAAGIPGLGHDFGRIRISSDRAATGGDGGARSIVQHHRHAFSASIRIAPPLQHDGMSGDERERAMDLEARASAAPPPRAIPGPGEGEAVLFPADGLTSVALPEQWDKIASTFGYKSSITQKDPPPGPGEFGVTRPAYVFESPGPSATQRAGTFDVTGTIVAQITFQVAGGTRTDIASDSDPDITQTNYPTVVSDLTPSPTAVSTGGINRYKNQPPRLHYWARDLTIKHECFHADEDVKFGREGVTLAQEWLNKQTARSYDDVGALLNRVTPIVAKRVETAMALPGREVRAYDDGAPHYLARAQAIKRKGDAKGYAAKPPATRGSGSPPAAKP